MWSRSSSSQSSLSQPSANIQSISGIDAKYGVKLKNKKNHIPKIH